jgi:CheY-like chemotaxis protein
MSVILPEPPQQTSAPLTVVDDDDSALRYRGNIVSNRGKGYAVVTARDRNSALAICKDRKVDCVLLDLDMPESGFDLLLGLVPNPKQPSIAVVILTRLVYPTLRAIAQMNGAHDWLVKRATSAEQLDAAIQKAVASVKSCFGK